MFSRRMPFSIRTHKAVMIWPSGKFLPDTSNSPVLAMSPWILAHNCFGLTVPKDMVDTCPTMTGSPIMPVLQLKKSIHHAAVIQHTGRPSLMRAHACIGICQFTIQIYIRSGSNPCGHKGMTVFVCMTILHKTQFTSAYKECISPASHYL